MENFPKNVIQKSDNQKQNDRVVVIPDVHGRTFWRKVLENTEDYIVFLGDYSDPYMNEGITDEIAIRELFDIIEFKKANPTRVTLLIGNHDSHYIYPDHACQRFNRAFFDEYNKLYTEDRSLFQIAFQWNEYLFTHAGLTSGWWNEHEKQLGLKINIATSLNNAYDEYPEIFKEISTWRGGMYAHGSPLWADAMEHDPKGIENVIQIFGHTQMGRNPMLGERINCLDCRKIFVLEKGEIQEYEC